MKNNVLKKMVLGVALLMALSGSVFGQAREVDVEKDLPLAAATESKVQVETVDKNVHQERYLIEIKFVEISKVNDFAKVIAKPMVVAVDGVEATIDMLEAVPILKDSSSEELPAFEKVGQSVTIKSVKDLDSGNIVLTADIKSSQLLKWTVNSDDVTVPEINVKQAHVEVLMKLDQKLVIGEDDMNHWTEVPGVMGSVQYSVNEEDDKEMVIMITPHQYIEK